MFKPNHGSELCTCELVKFEDGIFELRDVAQGWWDGAKNGIAGDVKVLQVLGIANAGWNGPCQLVVVQRHHLQLGCSWQHIGDGARQVVVACSTTLACQVYHNLAYLQSRPMHACRNAKQMYV